MTTLKLTAEITNQCKYVGIIKVVLETGQETKTLAVAELNPAVNHLSVRLMNTDVSITQADTKGGVMQFDTQHARSTPLSSASSILMPSDYSASSVNESTTTSSTTTVPQAYTITPTTTVPQAVNIGLQTALTTAQPTPPTLEICEFCLLQGKNVRLPKTLMIGHVRGHQKKIDEEKALAQRPPNVRAEKNQDTELEWARLESAQEFLGLDEDEALVQALRLSAESFEQEPKIVIKHTNDNGCPDVD